MADTSNVFKGAATGADAGVNRDRGRCVLRGNAKGRDQQSGHRQDGQRKAPGLLPDRVAQPEAGTRLPNTGAEQGAHEEGNRQIGDCRQRPWLTMCSHNDSAA